MGKRQNTTCEGGFLVPVQKFPSCPASALQEDIEEPLAIAEYDGHQPPEQAGRIAYQDAFIAALVTLPFEPPKSESSPQVWVHQRIQRAQKCLRKPVSSYSP